MKTYKEFSKVGLGGSDIAALVFVGCKENSGAVAEMIAFGQDDCYEAYMVNDKDALIGEHYTLVAEFAYWLKVYDDEELTLKLNAKHIRVYRAGSMGCIIQYWNN